MCLCLGLLLAVSIVLNIIAAYSPKRPPRLCNMREFQMFLNQLEPQNPLKEDGKIGKDTIEKWSRIYNEQCAVEDILRARGSK
jgi:hypothetical protein